jgi:acetolactate synthase regulatory subunit
VSHQYDMQREYEEVEVLRLQRMHRVRAEDFLQMAMYELQDAGLSELVKELRTFMIKVGQSE